MERSVQTTMKPSVTCALPLRIRSALSSHGQTLEQVQIVAPEFVVSELGQVTYLYAPSLGDRYRVDRARRRLQRLDPARNQQQTRQIRLLLGEVMVTRDDHPVEIDGYRCSRLRAFNQNAQLSLSVEAFCTRVPGLEKTALVDERHFDRAVQPFSIPLEHDEVVVRSITRALTTGFEQKQMLLLRAIEPVGAVAESYQAFLDYPVAG